MRSVIILATRTATRTATRINYYAMILFYAMSAPTQTTLLNIRVNSNSLFPSTVVNFTYTCRIKAEQTVWTMPSTTLELLYNSYPSETLCMYTVRQETPEGDLHPACIKAFLQPNRHPGLNPLPKLVKQAFLPLCHSFQLLHTYISKSISI
jgi:hypothetical protein